MVMDNAKRITTRIVEPEYKRKRFEIAINLCIDYRGSHRAGNCAIDTGVNDSIPAGIYSIGLDKKCTGDSNRSAKSDSGRIVTDFVDLYNGPSHFNYQHGRYSTLLPRENKRQPGHQSGRRTT